MFCITFQTWLCVWICHLSVSSKTKQVSLFAFAPISNARVPSCSTRNEIVSFLQKFIFIAGFLRRFRDPIRVSRISNRVPRIRENYHRVPKIRENRVLRIREIGSLQMQTWFLTFSLKKTVFSFHTPYHFDKHLKQAVEAKLLRVELSVFEHFEASNPETFFSHSASKVWKWVRLVWN